MNLYMLMQDLNEMHDAFDKCIVAAETIEDARNIHPNGKNGYQNKDANDDWVIEPRDVFVRYIGVAAQSIQKGVLIASRIESFK